VKQDRLFKNMHGQHVVSGQCRARSPVVTVVDDKIVSRWPLTQDVEFCGDHSDLKPVEGDLVF
jgi:uncharacterized linocin/CFP29 family protein